MSTYPTRAQRRRMAAVFLEDEATSPGMEKSKRRALGLSLKGSFSSSRGRRRLKFESDDEEDTDEEEDYEEVDADEEEDAYEGEDEEEEDEEEEEEEEYDDEDDDEEETFSKKKKKKTKKTSSKRKASAKKASSPNKPSTSSRSSAGSEKKKKKTSPKSKIQWPPLRISTKPSSKHAIDDEGDDDTKESEETTAKNAKKEEKRSPSSSSSSSSSSASKSRKSGGESPRLVPLQTTTSKVKIASPKRKPVNSRIITTPKATAPKKQIVTDEDELSEEEDANLMSAVNTLLHKKPIARSPQRQSDEKATDINKSLLKFGRGGSPKGILNSNPKSPTKSPVLSPSSEPTQTPPISPQRPLSVSPPMSPQKHLTRSPFFFGSQKRKKGPQSPVKSVRLFTSSPLIGDSDDDYNDDDATQPTQVASSNKYDLNNFDDDEATQPTQPAKYASSPVYNKSDEDVTQPTQLPEHDPDSDLTQPTQQPVESPDDLTQPTQPVIPNSPQVTQPTQLVPNSPQMTQPTQTIPNSPQMTQPTQIVSHSPHTTQSPTQPTQLNSPQASQFTQPTQPIANQQTPPSPMSPTKQTGVSPVLSLPPSSYSPLTPGSYPTPLSPAPSPLKPQKFRLSMPPDSPFTIANVNDKSKTANHRFNQPPQKLTALASTPRKERTAEINTSIGHIVATPSPLAATINLSPIGSSPNDHLRSPLISPQLTPSFSQKEKRVVHESPSVKVLMKPGIPPLMSDEDDEDDEDKTETEIPRQVRSDDYVLKSNTATTTSRKRSPVNNPKIVITPPTSPTTKPLLSPTRPQSPEGPSCSPTLEIEYTEEELEASKPSWKRKKTTIIVESPKKNSSSSEYDSLSPTMQIDFSQEKYKHSQQARLVLIKKKSNDEEDKVVITTREKITTDLVDEVQEDIERSQKAQEKKDEKAEDETKQEEKKKGRDEGDPDKKKGDYKAQEKQKTKEEEILPIPYDDEATQPASPTSSSFSITVASSSLGSSINDSILVEESPRPKRRSRLSSLTSLKKRTTSKPKVARETTSDAIDYGSPNLISSPATDTKSSGQATKKAKRKTPSKSKSRAAEEDEEELSQPIARQKSSGQASKKTKTMHASVSAERVIVLTGCNEDDKEIVSVAIESLGGAKQSNDVTKEVTHIVLGSKRRTMKLLMGIANGCWVVDIAWIKDSHANGDWLSEDKYEYSDTFPGCKKSRLRDSSATPILEGMSLGVSSKISPPTPKEVKQLIEIAGGKVVPESKCDYFLMSNGSKLTKAQLKNVHRYTKIDWLFDSLANYKLCDQSKYLVVSS